MARSLPAHILALRDAYPHLYHCLDLARVLAWQEGTSPDRSIDDFGPDRTGGRGTHYLNAQTASPMARAKGIEELLGLITHRLGTARGVVLDLLGGDGLIRQVAAQLQLSGLDILTCDLSTHMVQAARDAGIPALPQRAERLLCKDSSVDGVLLAYGTHHIDAADHRLATVKEAYRVLRPGGVFVLHDFEVGGPMDRWFDEVVNVQSTTGHPSQHFTRDEKSRITSPRPGSRTTGFSTRSIHIAFTGDTPEKAKLAMGEYLVSMYGLVKVEKARGRNDAASWALQKAGEIFGHAEAGAEPVWDQASGTWRMETPRSALIGVATRRFWN